MEKPLHIDIPDRYLPDIDFNTKCPATASYKLDYAACNHWKHPVFSITEQYYNAKDAFISFLQIDTRAALDIPVHFALHDLYWFYPFAGTFTISEGYRCGAFITEIPDNEYRIAYIPPIECSLRVASGKHVLFYFVIKSYWLMRRPTHRMEELQSLFAKLRAQLMESYTIPALDIRAKHRQLILSLCRQSKRLPVEQDCVVYDKVVQLLALSLSDLEAPETPIVSKSLQLLDAVHELISEKIAYSAPVVINEIASDFGVSTQYLCRIHRKYYQVSLKRYITEQKFNYARMLLEHAGLDINTVAHRLGYSQASPFSKQFAQYFGSPPSTYRKKE
ncbi:MULTISPECIES: AraC family transcriptional regulator [Olivibacter]|uniref:Helix-turn-helix domain-containing protein n=1 Tax=Olivibacter oleidegradans TaxID=760123 RepID=A0ABV6HLW2_9SPHI|nr:AraC family transcriptional regulator [Olivibacter jilunii]MDX3914532.1 AraC family transcriptional regulator [Pseudosphingobacterium sp.]